MRFLVLGAGAVGGYFGGRLAEAGRDVTFLVRGPRAAALAEHGLTVASPLGDFHVPVKTATAERVGGPYDVVLLTAKHYDLDTAIEAIRPGMGPDSAVLPLLNGLVHLDRLDAAFGADRVLGGVAYVGAALQPDGSIRHHNRLSGIAFGERDGGISERARAIEAAFAGTPVSAPASDNILLDMWEKFVMMGAMAGINCLMRGTIGEIMATEDGEALMIGRPRRMPGGRRRFRIFPAGAKPRAGPGDADRTGQRQQRLDASGPRSGTAHRSRRDPRRHDRPRRGCASGDAAVARRLLPPSGARKPPRREALGHRSNTCWGLRTLRRCHGKSARSIRDWRRGRDSNPRSPARRTTVFETAPIDRSGTSPSERRRGLSTPSQRPQENARRRTSRPGLPCRASAVAGASDHTIWKFRFVGVRPVDKVANCVAPPATLPLES